MSNAGAGDLSVLMLLLWPPWSLCMGCACVAVRCVVAGRWPAGGLFLTADRTQINAFWIRIFTLKCP